jgi:LL-diaminopimelate aminotransferase
MAYINENYLKLQAGYLFPEITRRVNAFLAENPEGAKRLIRCGIGDVTEPLPLAAREAIKAATDELGDSATFRGYGPPPGYDFLRRAVAENEYRARGIAIADDEIFISDGSKCDAGNILDIFGPGNLVAISDPVYPAYVDTNVMAGNTGEGTEGGAYNGLLYLDSTPENNFVPSPPAQKADIVYLCFPNNPTGAVATRAQLEAWVKYAHENDAILFYDAAYGNYITNESIPRSIYEIEGARECAIEFRSFSKNGGFTGVRCALTVVPHALKGKTRGGERISLHSLWLRRTNTKFNGVSYMVQRGAESLYSPEGKAQVSALIAHYMENARLLSAAVKNLGLAVWGGENAPYVWVQTPRGLSSWEVFDRLLREANIVVTPGVGFGKQGEGYFRISAFNSRANALEVARRLGEMRW